MVNENRILVQWKKIDVVGQQQMPMEDFQELTLDDRFRFSCHPGIACFNHCCRDLNQFLTPYDILRLKNRLKLSSHQFLSQYTVCHIGPRTGLPVVSLKMLTDENLNCPFVTPAGCAVYEDRPGSCRTYPLGRVAYRKHGEQVCKERYFLIREAHCLGFRESKQWTVREWKKNQQLETHNDMSDLMMDILSLKNRSGNKELTKEENDLFCMACYDLDRFKDFAFEKRLWDTSSVEKTVSQDIQEDDVALMRFGIEWTKRTLFGEPNET